MEWIRSFSTKIPSLHYDCDMSDRLSCTVTVTILCVMAASVTMKQIVGDAIACFCPAEFSGGQTKYVENLCWVMNTYYIHGTDVPKDVNDRETAEISYYQWIPYILLLQALLFYMPYLIWTMLNWQSGIHVSKVVRMAVEIENWKHGEDDGIRMVSTYLHCLFRFRKRHSGTCCYSLKRTLAQACMYCGKRYGNILVVVYFFIKLLYIGNVIGQLYMIHAFLGKSNYTFWGAEAITDIAKGRYWRDTGMFPRLTLCDFEIRRYANVHRHTVQCVLPINLFSEKLYIFMWFWCCFVAIVATFNILIWAYRMVSPKQKIHFIKTYLQMTDSRRKGVLFKKNTVHFVEQHLRYDGVLLLRLIVSSAGDIIAAKLVDALWKLWQNDRKRPGEDEQENASKNGVVKRISLGTASPRSVLSESNAEDNGVISNV